MPRELATIRAIGRVLNSVWYAARVGFLTSRVGPLDRVPPGVIEVIRVHRNGNSMIAAPASSAAYMMNLPVGLDGRDDQDQREEQPGQGRGLSGAAVAEGEVVDLADDDLAGAGGSAAGHDEDLVEDLEAVDQRDDHDEERGRRQQRQGDVAEPVPG